MSEQNDFADELRGDGVPEGGNRKGTDWVAVIVGGLIVSGFSIAAQRLSDRSSENDTRDRVIAIGQKVETISADVQAIKSAGYVGRVEFDREISRVDRRIDAVEQRGK